MRHVLGVDAGASKTLAAVADETGRILGLGQSGPGNHQVVGLEPAIQEIGKAAEEAFRAAAVASPVEVGVFGLAGADLPMDFAVLTPAIQRLGLAHKVLVENDTMIALRAGTTKNWGVVVVCGAGFNAAGISPTGQKFRLPGLGWISGDWGGGWAIAQEAIRAVCRAWDGRGPPTALTRLVLQTLHLPSVEDMIIELYQLEMGRSSRVDAQDLHRLVPVVFEAAYAGDAVAQELVVRIGTEVGVTASAVIAKLDLAQTEVEVVLAGGVFKGKGPLLMDTVAQTVHRFAPKARLRPLTREPVVGAVLWALEELGADIQPDTLTNTTKVPLGEGLDAESTETPGKEYT